MPCARVSATMGQRFVDSGLALLCSGAGIPLRQFRFAELLSFVFECKPVACSVSMSLAKPHSALIIVGHGSTLNPDSSNPTHQHADDIRSRGIFAEVVCAFWKEEPSMTEVFSMLESREIYIVPNFISEGYFCQQVLPRELRLSGPTTERDGRVIHYCDPVGIHPNMTRLLLQRADEVAPGIPRSETTLIIVGHGTDLNENSAKAIQDQVKLIRAGDYGFAEVLDTYMEEAPFVADWHKLSTTPNVVVVPFFISDGLHSYQDIPVLLGFEAEVGAAASERDVFRHNPHHLHGKCLFYSSSIGTEPHLADVILDQVEEFDRKNVVAGGIDPRTRSSMSRATDEALERWLDNGTTTIGQVRITRRDDGTFTLHHIDDSSVPAVPSTSSPLLARDIAKYDEEGKFRPLKTAPTLKRGWRLDLRSVAEVRMALDFLYPAALGMALEHERGTLSPVPLREMLGRQTGMYRFTNKITDEQANEMIATNCDTQTKCRRRILWGLTADQPLAGAAGAKCAASANGASEIPLLCMEACNHIVSAARKIARANHDAASAGAEAQTGA